MAPPPRARLRLFFDGGCRPNPGRIEVAVVARGTTWFVDDLGTGSSNDAEWHALVEALRIAQRIADRPFDLIGDCKAVIDPARGAIAPRTPSGIAHHARFLALAAARPPARIRWIGRAQNLAGIALARRHITPWSIS